MYRKGMITMNDILDFLNSHASVRQFIDKEISPRDEQRIITTAQRSPTSSNVQAYSVIGIRNPETKHTLARLSGNQQHVAQSSLFLVFCADLYRLRRINEQKGYQFHGEYTELFIIATVDAALVAGRALMAAQALGMGGVMVGGIRNAPDAVCELLHLPELVYPVMGMSLGYPVKQPKIKPRLPMEAIYHQEYYKDDNVDKYIETYDKEIASLGYLAKNPVSPEKYPHFTGEYSWSEHTARRMANSSPESLRAHLLDFLQRKGFLKK